MASNEKVANQKVVENFAHGNRHEVRPTDTGCTLCIQIMAEVCAVSGLRKLVTDLIQTLSIVGYFGLTTTWETHEG